MKAMEYLYLVAAGAMATLLAARMNEFQTFEMVLLLAGIFIMAFLYSFRRLQRIRMEQNEKNKKGGAQ